MKAIVYTQYGPPGVLQLKEVDKPSPKDNEILLNIKATAVNSGDWRLRKADPFAVRFLLGLVKPKINILGGVFSGEVEHVGRDVKLFKVGDQVFGHTDMRFGAYAEYICLPETGSLALKPGSLTHTEAAVIPFGGTTALYFIKKAAINPGQKFLLTGHQAQLAAQPFNLQNILGRLLQEFAAQ